MRIFILTILSILILLANNIPNHSTIFVYHHVSDETPKSTSISTELFEKHIEYLIKNNYKIWALEDIIEYFEKNKTIPKKTVAITFDDSYKSVYTNAYKVLKKYNLPFTVFINTSAINSSSLYLTWNELKKMEPLIHYGSHSHYHHFLIRESKEFIKKDLNISHKTLKENLDVDIKLFAYPFGEYDKKLKDVLNEFNYYGITQSSGSIDKNFKRFQIPRFPMNSNYGKIERFKSLLNMKPLNIENTKTKNRVFKENELKNKSFSFTIKETNDFKIKNLNCFDASGKRLKKSIYEKEKAFHVNVALPDWSMGRKKITCTVPSKTLKDVFYWNSELFYIKSSEGEWYNL